MLHNKLIISVMLYYYQAKIFNVYVLRLNTSIQNQEQCLNKLTNTFISPTLTYLPTSYMLIQFYPQLIIQILHQLCHQHQYLLHKQCLYQPKQQHILKQLNLQLHQPSYRLHILHFYINISTYKNSITNTYAKT